MCYQDCLHFQHSGKKKKKLKLRQYFMYHRRVNVVQRALVAEAMHVSTWSLLTSVHSCTI